MFYFEHLPDALGLLLFHFLPGSICSVAIYAVQQRLESKIEVLRNDSAAARLTAPGTLLRRSAARPVGVGISWHLTIRFNSDSEPIIFPTPSTLEMMSLIEWQRSAAVTAAKPFRRAYVPGGNQSISVKTKPSETG